MTELKNNKQGLDLRKYNLVKRCKSLTEGQGKITVELGYSWHWDEGVTGNLWLEGNDNKMLWNKLRPVVDKLQSDYNKSIEEFANDVERFVADGGDWVW